MPITVSSNQLNIKKQDGSGYVPANTYLNQSTSSAIAEVNAQGDIEVARVTETATEYTSQLTTAAELRSIVADAFAAATAYPAGKLVIHTDTVDGSDVNNLYCLPNGHAANDTWADTTKIGPISISDQVTGLGSIITEPFDASKDYPEGKYVINLDDMSLYCLPWGHEANVTWENTYKATYPIVELIERNTADIADENGVRSLKFVKGYYYRCMDLNTEVILTSDAGYCTAIAPCTKDDIVTLNVYGAGGARAYAYLREDMTVIDNAPASTVYNNEQIDTPPNGTAYIVVNNRVGTVNSYRPTGYYAHIGPRPDKYNCTKADDIEETIANESVATFNDGADLVPMKVKVEINSLQDFNGYERGPWHGGFGKNLINFGNVVVLYKSGSCESITATSDGNGLVMNPKSSASQTPYGYVDLFEITSAHIGKTYVLSCIIPSEITDDDYLPVLYLISSNGETRNKAGNPYTILSDDIGMHLAFRVYGDKAVKTNTVTYNNAQVEEGSTATSFEPYSNICQITGRTGVNISRSGKNLCKLLKGESKLSGNLISRVNKDGTLSMLGTNTSGSAMIFTIDPDFNSKKFKDYIITSGIDGSSSSIQMRIVAQASNSQKQAASTSDTVIADNGEHLKVVIRVSSGFANPEGGTTVYPMIRPAGTDNAFEAYGRDFPVTFPETPGTVYHGYLTIDRDGSAELVVDGKKITLDGTQAIALGSTGTSATSFYRTISDMAPQTTSRTESILYCDSMPIDPSAQINSAKWCISGSTASANIRKLYFYTPVGKFADADAFKTYLTTHPIDVVYKLETPVTYKFSAEQIKSLFGFNNVWADVGNVSVTYSADTKTWVNDKLDTSRRLVELIIAANRENSMTASKNYIIGNLIIVNGKLYRVTSNIFNGGSITENGNVVETTVESELERAGAQSATGVVF